MEHATISAGGHETWRARRVDERRPRRRRLLRCVLLSTIAIILLVVFSLTLMWPMLHPNTHVAFISADTYNTLNVPPLGFVEETWSRVQELEPALYRSEARNEPRRLESMTSPVRMERLTSELQSGLAHRSDVLIVYVVAHGISRNGEPWLLCEELDPARLERGLYSVRQLIRDLRETDARTRLLILDTGGIDYDPRVGIFVNEFPRLIRTLVEDPDVADSTLWVLNSNSVGQRSFVSPALRQSVFSHFVMQGLQGQADLDGDTVVDLGELYEFVSARVSVWVDQYSAGNEAQTPQLICGGDGIVDAYPSLISVSRFTGEQTNEPQNGSPDQPDNAAASVASATRILPLASHSDLFHLSRPTGRYPLPGIVWPAPATVVMSTFSGAQAADQQTGQHEDPTVETSGADGQDQTEQAGANGTVENESKAETAGEEDSQLITSATTIELLGEAWDLRDALESRRDRDVSPIDVDAQLWRVAIARSTRIEHLIRGGRQREADREAAKLNKTLRPLTHPPGRQEKAAGSADDLGRQIAEQLQVWTERIESPFTLAMDEACGSEKLNAGETSEKTDAAKLDEFLRDGKREEFVEWVGQLTDDQKGLYELRLAAALAPRDDLEWGLVQLALKARRRGEQVAAAPRYLPWIRSSVEEADRLRIEGERSLLDGLGDGGHRAGESLREALRLYEQASADLDVVRRATQVSNDLAFRVPYYVRLHNISRRTNTFIRPNFEELRDLLGSLQLTTDLLEEHRVEQIHRIQSLTDNCQRLRASLEADFSAEQAILLGETPADDGTAWRISLLLDQPLADGETRSELLRAADRAEAAFAPGFRPREVGNGQRRPTRVRSLDWESLRRQAELEVALARLAASRLPAAFSSYELLQKTYDEMAGTRTTGALPWDDVREFGERLEQFYRELPDQIVDAVRQCEAQASEPGKNLRVLQAAQRALRLLDVRDAARLQTRVQPLVGEARRYALLAWHRQRFLAAQTFAPSRELAYLQTAASAYRQQAVQIPNQPPIAAAAGPVLQMDMPDAERFSNTPEGDIEIQLENISPSEVRVWIILQYDPDLLEIRAPPDRIVYHEPASRAASDHQWKTDPLAQPSFAMPVNTSKTARIHLRRIGRSASDTRLIVKAVVVPTGESPPEIFLVDRGRPRMADTTRDTASDPAFALRRTIEIAVPAPEPISLYVDGTLGSWSRTADGMSLHCFPNTTTAYQLSLVNNSGQEKTAAIRILMSRHAEAIPMPTGALDPNDAQAFLARLEPATEVVRIPEVELPADDSPVPIPFPEVAPSENAEDRADSSGEQPVGDRDATAVIVPSRVSGSLFLLITDLQSQRLTAKRLTVAPQRPRRYVRAHAEYHLQDERVVVRVAARDPDRIPPGGVEVQAHFAEPLPPGTQAKLAGRLQAPEFETELYADVPRSNAGVVNVNVDIDRYPRAFVFRVPCNTHAERISEETTMQAIRILEPLRRDAFGAPRDSILASLQVDAPVGSFGNGNDLIELGIDADLDGEFRGESTVKLLSDRQLSATISGLSEDGTIYVDTRAGDHQVSLSTAGLENVHVNVLARLQAGVAEVWSDPVKILFDGEPPKITEVTLIPDQVTIGTPTKVAIGVTDEGGSGVEKAEVAFDATGAGKFAEEPAPVRATRLTGSQWIAELDTGALSPGSYALLARATDVVGNASEYTTIKGVQVITAEMAKQRQRAAVNRVLGTVKFGNEPAPGMEMTLTSTDQEGPSVGPVVADEKGNFGFDKVPPGTYALTAKGKVRNGGRSIVVPRGQEFFEVTVPPPPEPVVRLGTVQIR